MHRVRGAARRCARLVIALIDFLTAGPLSRRCCGDRRSSYWR